MSQFLEIKGLLRWAERNHTILHPSVEVYQDPVTGLSFRAAKEISRGTALVKCSYKTTLSYLNAIEISPQFQRHGSQSFPSEFINALSPEDPNIIGHFFLVQQYLLGEKSFWSNYIQLLPQPDHPESLGLPIWWPESDRKFLDGTNAEPPIAKRQELWECEWSQGIEILKRYSDSWNEYSYVLYQWAATIFGMRSFRASLTISRDILEASKIPSKDRTLIQDHIASDRFSILLPVLDIGNHDGTNRVEWLKSPETNQFILSSREEVESGSQIYNYYGDKSNSELLVGYGFTLPTLEQDMVNLKLTPPPDAVELRRSQTCHTVPIPQQAEEEFMFKIRAQNSVENLNDSPLSQLQPFSHGLFETIICMIANKRERAFLEENPTYCLHIKGGFEEPLYRSLFSAFHIISAKLDSEIQRISNFGLNLDNPQNSNQRLALDYRNRQLGVIKAAATPISELNQFASSTSSFCKHDFHHSTTEKFTINQRQMFHQAELLSLECAFDWLHTQYPDIHDVVVHIISEDQEEPLPLQWDVLVNEGWDHAYWIIWIYLIWVLWVRDGKKFQMRHQNLSSWLIEMNLAYDQEITINPAGIFLADPVEYNTINHTLQAISALPQLRGVQEWLASNGQSLNSLRNFASFVAYEEVVSAKSTSKQTVTDEKMIVICKNRNLRTTTESSWSSIFSNNIGTSNQIGRES